MFFYPQFTCLATYKNPPFTIEQQLNFSVCASWNNRILRNFLTFFIIFEQGEKMPLNFFSAVKVQLAQQSDRFGRKFQFSVGWA